MMLLLNYALHDHHAHHVHHYALHDHHEHHVVLVAVMR